MKKEQQLKDAIKSAFMTWSENYVNGSDDLAIKLIIDAAKQYHLQVDVDELRREFQHSFELTQYSHRQSGEQLNEIFDWFIPHLQKESDAWINVEDRLPTINQRVLGYEDNDIIYATIYTKILGFKSHSSQSDAVKFWQPLPNAPKNL